MGAIEHGWHVLVDQVARPPNAKPHLFASTTVSRRLARSACGDKSHSSNRLNSLRKSLSRMVVSIDQHFTSTHFTSTKAMRKKDMDPRPYVRGLVELGELSDTQLKKLILIAL